METVGVESVPLIVICTQIVLLHFDTGRLVWSLLRVSRGHPKLNKVLVKPQ